MVAARRVAVLVDVDDHLVALQAQALRGGGDDAAIGLVRDQELDILGRQAVLRQQSREHSYILRTAYLKTWLPSCFTKCWRAATVSAVAGMRLPPAGIFR